jgi:hypothetical protein
VEARRKSARLPADLFVRVRPASKPVVIQKEVAARTREIVEKVNERVAGHD